MKNRILNYFGLVTKKRAIELSKKIHRHYVECVVDGVKKDFGAKPKPDFRNNAMDWWIYNFTNVLNSEHDKITIINIPIFEEKK